MYSFGGNDLSIMPRKTFSDGSVLVYRRSRSETKHMYGVDYVQLAAVMSNRYARWDIMFKLNYGSWDLEVSNTRSWEVFKELPDMFIDLAELTDFDTSADQIISIFEKHGAVEQLPD